MYSPLDLFDEDPEKKLIVMPLTRVLVESQISIGSIEVIPPGELNVDQLRPSLNQELANELFGKDVLYSNSRGVVCFEGQKLRQLKSWLTGFNIDVLKSCPCACFQTNLDWSRFLDASHEDDLVLLHRLAATAERSFDVLRMELCRLDLPDTLPGAIGSWDGTGEFVGALVYCPREKTSHLIAGAAPNYSSIISGIGLDLNGYYLKDIPSALDGEVSGIVIHALSLLTDAMHARNDTTKFVRTMTLLEFLGSPDEYKQWKRLKGEIACHCVRDQQSYLRLLDRLRIISSFETETGEQQGYRTLVVHHGKFLEDILPDIKSRRKLFRELQGYCGCVIKDMLRYRYMKWEEFIQFRSDLKKSIGVKYN